VQKRQSKALQNAWKAREEAKITRELAATILQRSWRSYTGRRTMAAYKNLIAIHEHHDPREILRMINPREAEMMDAAAGAFKTYTDSSVGRQFESARSLHWAHNVHWIWTDVH
jgi:hypothetical protein